MLTMPVNSTAIDAYYGRGNKVTFIVSSRRIIS